MKILERLKAALEKRAAAETEWLEAKAAVLAVHKRFRELDGYVKEIQTEIMTGVAARPLLDVIEDRTTAPKDYHGHATRSPEPPPPVDRPVARRRERADQLVAGGTGFDTTAVDQIVAAPFVAGETLKQRVVELNAQADVVGDALVAAGGQVETYDRDDLMTQIEVELEKIIDDPPPLWEIVPGRPRTFVPVSDADRQPVRVAKDDGDEPVREPTVTTTIGRLEHDTETWLWTIDRLEKAAKNLRRDADTPPEEAVVLCGGCGTMRPRYDAKCPKCESFDRISFYVVRARLDEKEDAKEEAAKKWKAKNSKQIAAEQAAKKAAEPVVKTTTADERKADMRAGAEVARARQAMLDERRTPTVTPSTAAQVVDAAVKRRARTANATAARAKTSAKKKAAAGEKQAPVFKTVPMTGSSWMSADLNAAAVVLSCEASELVVCNRCNRARHQGSHPCTCGSAEYRIPGNPGAWGSPQYKPPKRKTKRAPAATA